jgi:hypothetical protein
MPETIPTSLDIPPYPAVEQDGDYDLAAANGICNGVVGGALVWTCLGLCVALVVRVIW